MAGRVLRGVARVLGFAAKALLMLALILVLLLTATAQFLTTAKGRSVVAHELGRVFTDYVGLRIEVEALDVLTLKNLDATLSMYDRRDRRMVRVEHISARFDAKEIFLSFRNKKPSIQIHDVRAQRIEGRLDTDWVTFARAFKPKQPRKKGPSKRPHISLTDVEVQHLEVALPKGIAVVRGRVTGWLDAPRGMKVRTEARLVGFANGYPGKLDAGLTGLNLRAKASLQGPGIAARTELRGELAGRHRLAFDATFDVPDFERMAWLGGTPSSGSARVRTRGQLDLRPLAMQGKFDLDGRRLSLPGATVLMATATGNWQGSLRTLPEGSLHLNLAGIRAGPWHSGTSLSSGLDLDFGRKGLRARASVNDQHGVLLVASGESPLPARGQKLKSLPLSVNAMMPGRALRSLPVPQLLSPDTHVTARAELRGTLASPKARLFARLRTGDGIVDLSATASRERAARTPSKLSALQDLRVSIHQFPLQAVTELDNVGIRGKVDGSLYADGKDGVRGVARLEVSALSLQGKAIPGASASLMLANNRLAGLVNMGDQERYLRTELAARLAAGKVQNFREMIEQLEVVVDARHFPIAVVLPGEESVPIGVRGELDGKVQVALGRRGDQNRLAGALRFSRGLVSIPSLGPALQDVNADVRLSPEGRIELAKFSARGVQGRIQGSGHLVMKGLEFESGRLTLRAIKGEEFAVWALGSQLGTVRGQVALVAQRLPSGVVSLRYDVPNLVLELPPPRSLRKPKREDPTIKVGVVTSAGQKLSLATEKPKPQRTRSAPEVKLAGTLREVRITRPGQLEIVLQGNPELEFGRPLRARGEVKVKEGWLNVLGKRFTVERGTVRFVGGEIAKASVVASASWVSSDGIRVRIGVQGTLGQLKTSLVSEPALPEAEIVQLVLTGGAEATPEMQFEDSSSQVATAVGTDAVARVVNNALSGIAPNVSARVDTTDPLNPQPEFEVQTSERVSVRVTTSLGETREGTDRSTTAIDYRAGSNWLVSGKWGDTGSTAIDVLWQYHY